MHTLFNSYRSSAFWHAFQTSVTFFIDIVFNDEQNAQYIWEIIFVLILQYKKEGVWMTQYTPDQYTNINMG